MPTPEVRAAIVAEARAWLGTPFRHQGAIKGVGVDAWGLVRAAGEAAGVLSIPDAAWAPFAGYPAHASPEALRARLDALLVGIGEVEAGEGDIVLLGAHLALLAAFQGRPTLIHVPSGTARVYATKEPANRVVEHGFREPWPSRATGFYRYPGLA